MPLAHGFDSGPPRRGAPRACARPRRAWSGSPRSCSAPTTRCGCREPRKSSPGALRRGTPVPFQRAHRQKETARVNPLNWPCALQPAAAALERAVRVLRHCEFRTRRNIPTLENSMAVSRLAPEWVILSTHRKCLKGPMRWGRWHAELLIGWSIFASLQATGIAMVAGERRYAVATAAKYDAAQEGFSGGRQLMGRAVRACAPLAGDAVPLPDVREEVVPIPSVEEVEVRLADGDVVRAAGERSARATWGSGH